MSQISHSTEADGAIHIVTLNRPDAQNALTMDMMNEIATLFHGLRDDKKVRAVILTGAGEKAFSAGVDLLKADGIFTSYFPTPLEKDPRVQIETFPWPVICAVNGFAITGGFELALACDILIASENASFADTHSKFGIAPAWGLSQKLARSLGPSRAKELHFSGRFIGAKEAMAWGLVNRVLPPQQLMPHCLDLAKEMSKMNPTMLRMMKQTVNDGYGMSFKDGCENEQNVAYKYYKEMGAELFEKMKAFIMSRSKGTCAVELVGVGLGSDAWDYDCDASTVMPDTGIHAAHAAAAAASCAVKGCAIDITDAQVSLARNESGSSVPNSDGSVVRWMKIGSFAVKVAASTGLKADEAKEVAAMAVIKGMLESLSTVDVNSLKHLEAGVAATGMSVEKALRLVAENGVDGAVRGCLTMGSAVESCGALAHHIVNASGLSQKEANSVGQQVAARVAAEHAVQNGASPDEVRTAAEKVQKPWHTNLAKERIASHAAAKAVAERAVHSSATARRIGLQVAQAAGRYISGHASVASAACAWEVAKMATRASIPGRALVKEALGAIPGERLAMCVASLEPCNMWARVMNCLMSRAAVAIKPHVTGLVKQVSEPLPEATGPVQLGCMERCAKMANSPQGEI
ncbi:unnamed protein product [Cladocopium goreaui]|uniref:Uncharacterized protein n=1 Tax=Cladocopium goreaui TaxID=2562237 RepID=A0A9P1GMI5_9DINO|nr:unnamed protein product [Cladocopium goreaui]